MAATMLDKTRQDKTSSYSAIYSGKFYKSNASDINRVSAYKIINIARDYVTFQSAIYIGCGVGNMLKACIDSGVETIRGVDGSWVQREQLMIPEECFTQYDLTSPNLRDNISPKHFDLTVSCKVAEHIDAEQSDIYFDNLTSFSDVILFSAVIPGHGGTHHVNEQYPSYWIEKFSARGFVPVYCIRPRIWYDDTLRVDYRQNFILYVKESILDNYPALKAEAAPCYGYSSP